MRDTNRSKVYAAEGIVGDLFDVVAASGSSTHRMPIKVAGSTLTLPDERRFADVASIQRYCDMVTDSTPAPRVRVRDRRGLTRAHYQMGEIAIPLSPPAGHRHLARELVVLHELAHHLFPCSPHHGSAFRKTYLSLLDLHMGPEAALLMQINYSDQGL